MEKIIRWGLHFVKRIEIDTKDPLPADVMDVLLKNQSEFYVLINNCISFQTLRILKYITAICRL